MDLDNNLEEGELSNDSNNDYTPLERPASYSALTQRLAPKKSESESDDNVSTSSSSGSSDSDSPCFRAKKPKIKAKKKLPKRLGSKMSKYNVWSNRAQEDSLLAINSCDVSHKDRSRDVESYDHSIAREYYKEQNNRESIKSRINNKRNRSDRKDASLRLTNRHRNKSSEEREVKGQSRILLEINCCGEQTDTEVAVDIANKLYEEKEELIVKVVNALGREKAIKIYNEVKRIEADGGMLIMNQTRRRTPGGIYLFLLKHDDELTAEQRSIIFEDEKKNYKEYLKAKKKKRNEEMKRKIGAGNKVKNLPELLTKADLVQKLNQKSWTPKEDGDNDDVVNPPPTPETDGHVDSEGMEMHDAPLPLQCADNKVAEKEKLDVYESDFLNLSAGNDMDMF